MNTNQKRRDEIMKIEEPTYIGGLQPFEELNAEQLEALITEDFIAPTDSFKGVPKVSDLLDFMKQHEDMWAHGVAIGDTRGDYRLTIKGLRFLGRHAKELKEEFESFCGTATDLILEHDELFSEW
jgi:hypothetical protein